MQLTADGMPVDPGRAPRQVRRAVGVLGLVALLGVVSLVLEGLVSWELAAQEVRRTFGAAVAHETFVGIFVNAAGLGLPTYGVFLVFLVKTWQGRNWARITTTVLVAPPLFQVAIPPDHVAETSLVVPWITVGVVTAAGVAFGMFLLWQDPAGTWFRAMRAYRAEWGHWPKR